MRTAAVLVVMMAVAASGCTSRVRPAPVPDPPPAPAPAVGAAGGEQGPAGMHGPGMRGGGMQEGRGMHGRGMHGGGMHPGMSGRADDGSADSAAAPLAADACPAVSPALVDEGRRVFGGASCAACHGAGARGTPLAPDLGDEAWLHGDGSYASIAAIVAAGVARPLRHPAMMPPRGGANLSDAEVCAVAAWVRALGR